MRRTAAPLALALALAASLPAWAEAPLGLSEALAIALEANPLIRAAARQVEASQAREVQAGALPNPNLTLEAEGLAPGRSGGGYRAELSQPLLLGGLRETRQEAARLDRAIASHALTLERRGLTLRVQDANARLLFAQGALRDATQHQRSAQTLLKAARLMQRAGEVAQVEVLRAEVEASRAEREVEASESRLVEARSRLNLLLARPALAPLEVRELPEPQPGALPPLEKLVAQALATREELAQADALVQRESAQRRLAQASLWTGSAVGISGGLAGGQPGLGASLTLPIPFYRQAGEIAEAEANRARAEAQREALRAEIAVEVGRAYREAELSAKQVARFRTGYLPQAERLLDNAQRRFQAGEGGGVEVVEARRALSATRLEYRQAILDHRLAIAGLERATGLPPER